MTRRFPVYNLTFAHKLTEMGFVCEETRINKANPKYMVYLFRQDEGIEEALKMLIENR